MGNALAEAAGIRRHDRKARGHRFERHETTRLGLRGEDADVGARVDIGEAAAVEKPELPHPRQPGQEPPRFRALARHHERGALAGAFVRRNPRLHEDVDVLLGGQTADVQDDCGIISTGEPAAPADAAPSRIEVRRVDAATPDDRVADAAALELGGDGLSRRLRQHRELVEPAQPFPHERLQCAGTVMPRVLGEIRVIRRHQRDAAPLGVAAADQSQRAFRRDVHELRLERIEKAGDGAELRQREPDRGIWRKGRRWNAQFTGRFSGAARVPWRNYDDLVAEFP